MSDWNEIGSRLHYALLEYNSIFVIYWPRSIIMRKKNSPTLLP
jgi:hypothetical protein